VGGAVAVVLDVTAVGAEEGEGMDVLRPTSGGVEGDVTARIVVESA